jgi:hypothetical protein
MLEYPWNCFAVELCRSPHSSEAHECDYGVGHKSDYPVHIRSGISPGFPERR